MSERNDPPKRRARFDPDKVERLLGTGGGLLGELTVLAEQRLEDQAADRWLGIETGPYRIVEYLDRGGMSLVFRAERCDGQFEQQVAIKLLRTPDAAELARRFERERRLLARLEHPGIARIIDSGVAADQPWIAMELVAGLPIDQYCDRQRLGVGERLDLLVRVARAVQFAHSRLIVHRDLKPSNILVNADGQPKLLDFGIAKALQSDGGMDLTGQRLLLTPMYASPEQVLGEPVGLSSDIYQLGLLLYRLLTGRNAQDLTTPSVAEIKSVVVDQDPLRPSSQVSTTGRADAAMAEQIAEARATTRARLIRRLDGDLDAIVLKSLGKDPESRYTTVQELISDIEAYRQRRPISARRAGRLYRMKRFAQRNWGGVTAAGLVALALIVGTLLASLGMVRAERAEAAAQDQAARAKAISDFMVDVFDASRPRVSGDESLTAKALLENAVAKVDEELAGQPLLRATMLERIGAAHAQLGLYEAAEALLMRALAIHEELDEPVERADVEHTLGRLYLDMRRTDESVARFRAALEGRRSALGGEHPDTISSIQSLGLALAHTDSIDESIEHLQTALDRMPPGDSPERSAALNNLGFAHRQAGNSEPALPLYLDAIEMDKRLGKSIEAAEKLGNVGMLHMEAGRFELAKAHFRDQIATMEPAFGTEHPDLITPINNLAFVLNLEQDFAQALPLYRRAQAISEASLGPDHWHAIILRINIANLNGKSGRYDEVLEDYRAAVNDLIGVLGAEHFLSSRVRVGLADLLLRTGAIGEASELLSESERRLTESVGAEHVWTAQVFTVQAQTHLERGAGEASLAAAEAALAIQDAAGKPADPYRIRALSVKAAALNQLGRQAEARDVLEAALALVSERYGKDHAVPLDLARRLCAVELDAGEIDSARTRCEAALIGVRERYPAADAIQVADATLARALVTMREAGCAKALAGLSEALRVAEDIAGPGAFATWPYRVAYADCLNDSGEHGAALAQARRADEILTQKLTGSSWQRWVVDSAIAESMGGLGQREPARARMDAAASALRAALPGSPELARLEARAERMSG